MSQDAARDALFDAIAEKAPDADPAELVKLGHTYSHIVHGAQGGNYIREGRDQDSMDYHYTSHAGQGRDRPAGFEQ